MNRADINVDNLLLFFLSMFTLFQLPLREINPVFNYFDETLTILCFIYILMFIISRQKVSVDIVSMIIIMMLVIVLGIVSNITSGVVRNILPCLVDMFSLLKLFLCFIGTTLFFESRASKENEKLLSNIALIIRIIVYLAVVFWVLCMLGITPTMGREVRYGIVSYNFIYGKPGMLSQYCIGFLMVLTADLEYNYKKNSIAICFLLFIWCATLRSRAFLMVLIYILLYVFILRRQEIHIPRNLQISKVIRIQYIIPMLIIGIIIGGNQIIHYFSDLNTARALLLYYGMVTMMRFLPFGAGFASFGTEMAGRYYSPLYYEYGMNEFKALNVGGSELTDCYWPAIGAELGILGIVCFVLLVYFMSKQILWKCAYSKWAFLSGIMFVIVMLVASMATGSYCSYVNSGFMVLCGLIIGCARKENN